jgi:hypothetical protein
MNTGKIMIGFSLVMLSIAMMVSPSAAAVPEDSREVGCGIFSVVVETGCPAGLQPGPAPCSPVMHPVPMPHTRTNDEHPCTSPVLTAQDTRVQQPRQETQG